MLENNTDRLFWALAAAIITGLVLMITVKLAPYQAKSVRNSTIYAVTNGHDHKSVDDSHYDKEHNRLLSKQKQDEDNSPYKFTYNDSDNTATVIGYNSIPKNLQVIIPQKIEHNDKSYKVTTIGPNAFQHTNIETVVLPDSLTTISVNAFEFSYISTLILPDSITEIQSYAFDSNNLSQLNLPQNNNLQIADNAFTNNHLTNVVLPNNSIGVGPFDKGVNVTYQLVDNATKASEALFSQYRDVHFQTLKSQNLTINNQHQIVDGSNNKQTNMFVQDADGNFYYLDSNAIPLVGMQTLNNQTYFFNAKSGVQAKNRIITYNGQQMYFDKNGQLVKSQSNISFEGTKYSADNNGYLTKQDTE